eukprot:TRINITY_DN2119_c0_g1_i4.p1 TRINITY_DN2119_c0_g1~~TRINITY_DN2119_c0_g1_i4.p1  ORF type:complete len:1135 (-),score=227.07 TRINITY_DN2119_c0_g1_i4:260-3664(-)
MHTTLSASATSLLLRVSHKVGTTESVKVVKFSRAQTVSEAVQTIALKYLRNNPNAAYENFGLLLENGQWLDDDKCLDECGLADQALVTFKSKLHQIVIKFIDGTSRKMVVNIAIPISQVIDTIVQQMEFKFMKNLRLSADYAGIDFENEKSLYSQADLEKGVFRLSQRSFEYSHIANVTDLSQITPFELHLLYVQALKFIVSGEKSVSHEDAIFLAAIQAQEEFGDFNPASMTVGFLKLKDYLPSLWVRAPNVESDIYRRYRRLLGTTKAKAKARYICHCAQLQDYTLSYYVVKEEKREQPQITFAIACDSIFRMEFETQDVITHYPLVRLKRWRVTSDPEGIKMDFGDYEDGMIVLSTPKGEEISKRLTEYIEVLTKKKKGETKASKCEVSGSGLTLCRLMSQATFVIQARDGNGCNKTAGGDEFRVYILPHTQSHLSVASLADMISSNQVITGEVLDNTDGTYTVTYSVKMVGDYSLHVLLGKNQLPGCPFLVKCRADASPSKCYAVGDGATSAIAGQETKFDVHVHDEKGDRIRVGGDEVIAYFEDRAKTVFVHDNNDGSYIVSYLYNIIGSYRMSVLVNGEHIRGSPLPIQVVAGKLLATNCYALGEGLNSGTAGEQSIVAIQAVDMWNNNITTGGHTFSVNLQGPVSVVGKVDDHGDGRYYASFTTSKAGVYSLSITHLGQHIKGSPYTCLISHGDVVASVCDVIDGFPKSIVAGDSKELKIKLCDVCENEVTSGDFDVRAFLDGNGRSQETKLTRGADGRFSHRLNLTESAKYSMRIVCDGHEIKGSPFFFEVLPSCFNAEASTLVNSIPEQIVSGTRARFVYQLKDAYGNLVRRTDSAFVHLFALEVRCGPVVVKGANISIEGDGNLVGDFMAGVAGSYSITVQYDGVILGGSKLTSTVVSGSTNGPSSVAFGSGLFGGMAGQKLQFTIQAKDSHFNPKIEGGDEFRVELSGAMLIEALVQDAGDGKYTVSYSVDQPGQYIISATHSGQHILGSPFVATVTDPSQVSVLEVQQKILSKVDALCSFVESSMREIDAVKTNMSILSESASSSSQQLQKKVEDIIQSLSGLSQVTTDLVKQHQTATFIAATEGSEALATPEDQSVAENINQDATGSLEPVPQEENTIDQE